VRARRSPVRAHEGPIGHAAHRHVGGEKSGPFQRRRMPAARQPDFDAASTGSRLATSSSRSLVTWPDGRTERFRDNPVRHLVVEPDPQTGGMRPVTKFP
jgi:hypothetical protein